MSQNLQMNLGSWLYFEGQSQLLNWRYVCNPIVIHRTVGGDITGKAAWDAGIYLDPTTGELKNPVPADVVSITRVFYAPYQNTIPGSSFAGETGFCDFAGSGTTSLTGISASALVSGNKYSFTTDGSTASITHTITNVNDPPRNVKIYQARYATNVANGETWNPDWLAAAGQWDVMRWLNPQSQNNSWQTDFSQLADLSYGTIGQFFGLYFSGPFTAPLTNCDYGPKGSVHPSLICDIANLTGKVQHVTIPLHFTDAAVTSFATYMRDNTTKLIKYELSNECWNFGFYQFQECQTLGSTLWPGDGQRAYKYYGYRAAQVMKLIRDVYTVPNRARWEGVLGTQTANPGGVTDANISGANQYLAGVSLAMSDVFDSIQGATYFGDVILSASPTTVTQGTSTTINFGSAFDLPYVLDPINGSPTVGNTYGVEVTFDPGGGYAAKTGRYNAVYASTTSLTISTMNTTGLPAFSATSKTYVNNAGIFDLITQSAALNGSAQARYPTVYQYFNEQLRDAVMTGTSAFGYSVSNSLNAFVTTQWPAIKTRCVSTSLKMEMYEGGNTVSGDVYLSGFGGNPILTPYLIQFASSRECSEALGAMFQAFLTAGGQTPSKFNFEGDNSQFGPWATYQFGPLVGNSNVGDTGNPIFKRCQVANQGNRQVKVIL